MPTTPISASTPRHYANHGTHFDISAAGSFLLLAHYAYSPEEQPAPRLRTHIDMILARAAAGFGQADIFCTLLSKGEQSGRVRQLAEEVVADVGGDAVMLGMIRDFKPKGAAQ
ncbi:hypothetical protein D0T25_06735 [Duganella sp. BJB488]|uniref:hypothetical protein n=1 Tax=unclassified Duganella TaxID=2636909 RepID=UPI000E345965|nr:MULTISPECIES: hypothetical protein [unclassified Duganella]RFP23173.1 hypothetical protein D0T26_09115 [Duganella sp. BJB489]RFP24751.1 hypothetical protein D0T25_06735 [Duganella sp. BJB488]RFP34171.1 hypothetical protein D0T24_17495 [Duganella sp. BJB480]